MEKTALDQLRDAREVLCRKETLDRRIEALRQEIADRSDRLREKRALGERYERIPRDKRFYMGRIFTPIGLFFVLMSSIGFSEGSPGAGIALLLLGAPPLLVGLWMHVWFFVDRIKKHALSVTVKREAEDDEREVVLPENKASEEMIETLCRERDLLLEAEKEKLSFLPEDCRSVFAVDRSAEYLSDGFAETLTGALRLVSLNEENRALRSALEVANLRIAELSERQSDGREEKGENGLGKAIGEEIGERVMDSIFS